VQDQDQSSSQSLPRDPDWTFVQPTPQSAAAGEAAGGAGGAGDSVHSLSAEPAPAADPRIQEAVEKMVSMGYPNTGGWLTSLLVAYNGDINSALDAIKHQG